MRLLLIAVMLSVLGGCVVYDDGYYSRRGGDGWYSHDGGHGHRHHRGHGNDQGEDD